MVAVAIADIHHGNSVTLQRNTTAMLNGVRVIDMMVQSMVPARTRNPIVAGVAALEPYGRSASSSDDTHVGK
jgi:hypothetical protein